MIVPNKTIINFNLVKIGTKAMKFYASAFFCALLFCSCEKDADEVLKNNVFKVSVVRAKPCVFEPVLKTSGLIAAREEIKVRSSIKDVELIELLAEEGSYVHKDQIIGVIENSANNSELVQTEAKLESAKENLKAKKADLDNANENLKRFSSLANQNAVSRFEFDKYKLAKKNALYAYNEALSLVNELEAKVKDSRFQDSKSLIKAPCDGLVIRKNIYQGEKTSENDLFVIARSGETELISFVSADELALLKAGMEVAISSKFVTYSGKVRKLSETTDSLNGLAEIRISFDEKVNLPIGYALNIQIKLDRKESPVCVPFSAVSFDNKSNAIVKVVDKDGIVHEKIVQPGTIYDDYAEIKSGLEVNETVIKRAGVFSCEGDFVETVLVQGAGDEN